jgi:hypothetical protein
VQRFARVIALRLGKFHIELAPEKTRQIVFGRHAHARQAKTGEFTFLGFRHICGRDRQGRFAVIRLPDNKRLSRFRQRVKEWLRQCRHWRVKEQQEQLGRMLQGFYQYYAVPHSLRKLQLLVTDVEKYWKRALSQRSQRAKAYWSVLSKQPWFRLPQPRFGHPRV